MKMEYIIILIISMLFILIVKYGLNVKIKDLNRIKEIGYNKELNDITNKLPENREVCEQILKQLKNESVTIETSDDKKNKVSYYIVITNHIIIADIKNTFTRIQTIAHECIHSIQNRKMLLFNFFFSNVYILYFFAIIILTLLHIIKNPMIQIIVLTMLGSIYYIVRSYLETDAMTRAPYVAKPYLQNSEKVSNEEIDTVIQNYEILNKMGITMTNFQLATSVVIKIIVYCIIAIIANI